MRCWIRGELEDAAWPWEGAGSRWDRTVTQDGRKAVRLQLFAGGWRMEGGAEHKVGHTS